MDQSGHPWQNGVLDFLEYNSAGERIRVELKAWIPQWRAVDPEMTGGHPTQAGWDAYIPGRTDGGLFCYNPFLHPVPPREVQGWYQGDDHDGYEGTSRVKASVEFTLIGGSVISDAATSDSFGVTHQWRAYRWANGVIDSCILRTAQATQTVSATVTGPHTFKLHYDTSIPTIAGAPTITGNLEGEVQTNGNLRLHFHHTDSFPNHGVQVVRNGQPQYTMIRDVSCLGSDDVMRWYNAAKIFWGLNNAQREQVITVTPTTSGTDH